MHHTYALYTVPLLALLASGCRLPGRDGAGPQALVDCRRLSQQGMAALERGDQPKAETLLAQAVTACPVDADARRRYAEALWHRGAGRDAVAQMEEAGRLAPDDASLWARLAEMRLAGGQSELASHDAELAARLDPKLSTAWAIHGGALWADGRPEEALAEYLRALRYAPNDRTILLAIAELHRELNQPDRALQTLQALADTYAPGEEPGQVLHLTGLAYVALGRYDDGVESFCAAVQHGSATAETFCRLGEAQLLAGRPVAAAAAVQQALALQPTHQPSRELLRRVELARQPQGTVR